MVAWVRDCVTHGAGIVTADESTKFLAYAGLLQGRRCAVHWSEFGAAVENYPSVKITRNLYEVDGAFHTCAGQMSTLDVMLEIIRSDQGVEFVDRLGSFALHGSFKAPGHRQALPEYANLGRFGSPLLHLVDIMSENIAEPLPLKTLTKDLRLSRRQIERLFEKQIGVSPKRFYLRLRLERAHDLLKNSSLPVIEVAVATGFVSASHFSKTYKLHFGVIPLETRRASLTDRTSDAGVKKPNNDNRHTGRRMLKNGG